MTGFVCIFVCLFCCCSLINLYLSVFYHLYVSCLFIDLFCLFSLFGCLLGVFMCVCLEIGSFAFLRYL